MKRSIILLLAAALGGCGGADGFFTTGATGTSASVATLSLLVSSPQLGSSGATPVTITAIVKDSSNVLLEGIDVVFSANSGALTVTQGTTDASGQAIASLTPGGDYTNRSITVTAVAGSLSQTTTVNVTGTTLSISGETAGTLGDTITLTMVLTDSASTAISGKAVTISSAAGNTLSAATLTTSSTGQVQVNVTAAVSGADTITATAQGATALHALTVSGDNFQFTAPASGADINLGTCQIVTLSWQAGTPAVPQAGQALGFSATRGTVYSDAACTVTTSSATTNGAGVATVYIKNSQAGPSTITAQAAGGSPSTSRAINFVATTAASIELQADKTSIGPNDGSQAQQQQSIITATVRDAANNLVKGKVIRFSITQDTSGGSLTTAASTTSSLGRATTTYVSSAATTAKDGVVITAWVEDTPAVTTTINLTVAQSELFVRLGTGNLLGKVGSTLYDKKYTVIVTDASGNAVEGSTVNISVNPVFYRKGFWWVDVSKWVVTGTVNWVCASEDLNENGIVDPGEDVNNNATLEPGNIASAPSTVTTGADGTYEFSIIYPREYAIWVDVRLTATSQVAGTEASHTVVFNLPVAAEDTGTAGTAPPGIVSPFGDGDFGGALPAGLAALPGYVSNAPPSAGCSDTY